MTNANAAFCGLHHSESEVYYGKSRTIGRQSTDWNQLDSVAPAEATAAICRFLSPLSGLRGICTSPNSHESGYSILDIYPLGLFRYAERNAACLQHQVISLRLFEGSVVHQFSGWSRIHRIDACHAE